MDTHTPSILYTLYVLCKVEMCTIVCQITGMFEPLAGWVVHSMHIPQND